MVYYDDVRPAGTTMRGAVTIMNLTLGIALNSEPEPMTCQSCWEHPEDRIRAADTGSVYHVVSGNRRCGPVTGSPRHLHRFAFGAPGEPCVECGISRSQYRPPPPRPARPLVPSPPPYREWGWNPVVAMALAVAVMVSAVMAIVLGLG